MVDFIKVEIKHIDWEELENNPKLDFRTKINQITGETSNYCVANHKGLTFKIIDSTKNTIDKRVTLEGSLHKYFNNGEHNYNDFSYCDLISVCKKLKENFNIVPKHCIIRQLEIGINIIHDNNTKKILDSCLFHKKNEFKTTYVKDEGQYIQAQFQRHFIKIYNKRKHYEKKGYTIDNEILRFEMKFIKMADIKYKFNIISLEDLLRTDFEKLGLMLHNEWDNILLADKEALSDVKMKVKYRSQNWWRDLNNNQFKYHRNKLNTIIDNTKNNIKEILRNKIKTKTLDLACTVCN